MAGTNSRSAAFRAAAGSSARANPQSAASTYDHRTMRRPFTTGSHRQMSRACRFLPFLLLVALGCSPAPRAPLLRDEAVYHNRTQGVRFMVPEGWRISAKAELPPGRIEQERLLVEYVRHTAVPATLQLFARDVAPGESVAPHLEVGRAFKAPTVETGLTVGGLSAERLVFTPAGAGQSKEVIAIRRGERFFFFTGLFNTEDSQGRAAFRRAVDTVVWEK